MEIKFCEKCKNTGYIIKYTLDRCYAQKCECYEITIAKQRVEKSGMLKTKTFENFIPTNKTMAKVKSICQDYSKEKSLIITGQVGTGKTHLCMAIGNKLLKEGIPVIYMDYRKVISDLKFNITDREYFLAETHKYITTKTLIIDDLFKNGATVAELRILYEITNERYKKNLNFIITSEKSLEELLDIDEAITSRIVEKAKGNIIDIRNEDNYRLKEEK